MPFSLFRNRNGGSRSQDGDAERGGFTAHLLANNTEIESAVPAKNVTVVALKLKRLIEATVPCDLKESYITKPHSPVITRAVVECAKKAASDKDRGCVIFALLICMRWFKQQANLDLTDASTNYLRAIACQAIAKKIIEGEDDEKLMMEEMLLKRYSILRNGKESDPASALERACDLHATTVIASSGYQKCISYLWKGWIIQDPDNPAGFTTYKKVADTSYWAHFDHERMRAPIYQNAFQIMTAFIYLILYSIVIHTLNPEGVVDAVEVIFYLFTLGYIFDEASKFYKVGRFYLRFWNAFNLTLYSILCLSLLFRIMGLVYARHSEGRERWQQLSYSWLSVAAPMVWTRMLLFLDSIKFFGAMLVVLKVMMKESLIFFALLIVVMIGFLQAFIGLDSSDNVQDATSFIVQAMLGSLLGSPVLEGFDDFAAPFGLILYQIFTFIVMVILLNVLIALYNQAYTDITENATDEYLALYSHKTIQFVRAPDENVFIPPLNLVEIFGLILPMEWWMPKQRYAHLNDIVMKVCYSPFLLGMAWWETKQARWVSGNRARGEEDDDTKEEWEEFQGDSSVLEMTDGWEEEVKKAAPNVEEDLATQEVKRLRTLVEAMGDDVKALKEKQE